MADPYRTSDSAPCPRCGLALVEDDHHDLVCGDGCGRWIPATELERLLGTANLRVLSQPIAHWKARPFANATCPMCQHWLSPQYMPLPGGDVLTHGYCTDHGAWLDGGNRDDLAAAYKQAIAKPVRTLTAVERIKLLEQRVATLERQLAEVRELVGRRKE